MVNAYYHSTSKVETRRASYPIEGQPRTHEPWSPKQKQKNGKQSTNQQYETNKEKQQIKRKKKENNQGWNCMF